MFASEIVVFKINLYGQIRICSLMVSRLYNNIGI